jgi:eukaryotic-like serine/threonine-protein kinase
MTPLDTKAPDTEVQSSPSTGQGRGGTRFGAEELSPASLVGPQRMLGIAGFEERYQRESSLGEGGMGEVTAYRDRSIGRDVAVKRVRDAKRQRPDVLERFVREGGIQGQLEHPSIVPVYDLRLDAAGDPALIMKRVRGKTFETLLEEHAITPTPLSTRRLLDLFLRACEGIAYAHARGVIHRDLKPANIMVGNFGEVYVLDWGIAKLVSADASQELAALATTTDERAVLAQGIEDSGENKTEAGTVVGTPGYMSPEQFFGESIDARSDLFALGLILFEILTGQPYFLGRSLEELGAAFHGGGEPRPSSRRRDLYIPPELDELAYHATRKVRELRLPSTAEFVRRLERYLAGEKSTALRQAASNECIDAARALLRANKPGNELSVDDRQKVLRQIGKALAFDPKQDAAVALLDECWSLPIAQVPAEVEQLIADAQQKRSRDASVAARYAYASWFLYLPICIMMGVRDWIALGFATFFFATAALLSWINVSKHSSEELPVMAFISGLLGLGTLSTMFGSLFFVPMVAMGALVLFSVNHIRKPSPLVLLLVVALVVGLPLAEWFGLLSSSVRFESGIIRILPRLVSFDRPEWVFAFLVLTNVGVVTTFLGYVHWMKRRLLQDQQAQAMQAWHLRQLFPVISEGGGERRTVPPAVVSTP